MALTQEELMRWESDLQGLQRVLLTRVATVEGRAIQQSDRAGELEKMAQGLAEKERQYNDKMTKLKLIITEHFRAKRK